MALDVQVVSPERILYAGAAQVVVTRTTGGGDIAFLTGHTHFLGALSEGVTLIRTVDGDDKHLAVHGGFVEVSHDHVTILSDVAELAEDIDVERARQAQERAEAALRAEHDGEAESALRRAHVRLAAVEGSRGTAH